MLYPFLRKEKEEIAKDMTHAKTVGLRLSKVTEKILEEQTDFVKEDHARTIYSPSAK